LRQFDRVRRCNRLHVWRTSVSADAMFLRPKRAAHAPALGLCGWIWLPHVVELAVMA
jgi:hypothetical protein